MRHFAKQTKIIYVFGKVRTLCSCIKTRCECATPKAASAYKSKNKK